MEAHLTDWLSLLARWAHFIAGIAWIGSSFYFIWLDRALSAPAAAPSGSRRPAVEGMLWMVHSGGFYTVEKRRIGPGELPAVLHWFKWEALLTWISGVALLILVYYLGGSADLIDPHGSPLRPGPAMLLGAGLLPVGWLVYDLLWRAPLAERRGVGAVLSFALLAAATYALCRTLAGRAAYMHVGTLIGTLMVANVWLRILPAQREMIAATEAGRQPNFALGERAKRRSVHNSYLTFPLLFIMLSNHYPATYAAAANWVVLLLLVVAGAAVRHTMIAGPRPGRWAIAPAAAALAAAVLVSAPAHSAAAGGGDAPPAFAAVREIVIRRCLACHSAFPTASGLGAAPAGVMFDTPEAIHRRADRIAVRAVATQTMPPANVTGMTAGERALLGRWVTAGAPLR